jgi:hypothetical protein
VGAARAAQASADRPAAAGNGQARASRSGARGAGTRGFSGTSDDGRPRLGVLGLERDDWREPDAREPIPAAARPELEDDDYEAEPPAPLEWTPERAGSVVRGIGFALHKSDGLHHEPGGEELWRATAEDVDMIAPPLSRILNRYAPARRLAGVTDEAELAFGVIAYTRENLALRGRLVRQRAEREERPEWGPGAGDVADADAGANGYGAAGGFGFPPGTVLS